MSEMKQQALRSVAITLGAQASKVAIGLGVTMVLARLLTPRDYGVVAMVSVLTGFVGVFRDGGLSIVTVQRVGITDTQISTLFWLNVALGTGTAMVLALLSPFVAWFYNDRSLAWMVLALAVPFILGGLTAQLQALLQRQMQFRTIASIEIASLIISACVGIMTAAAGWGSWALVTMTIALAVANTALVFVFCRWRPSRPVRGSGVRSMLHFGGVITATKLFDSLASSTDILLLGKLFPADMVGLYTRAQTLMLQPLTQIMPPLLNVALPVISRVAESPNTLRRVFLDLLQLTAFASSFITVYLVVGADWLIAVFLGPRWTDASALLRLLAGPALFIPVSALCVLSLTSQGKGSALMRWGMLKNIVIVLAILAGIARGAKGVAAALSIASVFVLLPLLLYITSKVGPASLKEIWWATGPAVVFSGFGCGVLYLIRCRLVLDNQLVGLFALWCLNCALHLLIMGALPSCRRSLARALS